MRMHFLLHVPFEGPGAIEPWAVRKGFAVSKTRFWLNESLPNPREIDWLAIMGGPMSVRDEEEHPWLAQEKLFIREAIRLGRTVLGICLGAQLIAGVLGGKVRKNAHKEIGWFPVTLTDAGRARPSTFPLAPSMPRPRQRAPTRRFYLGGAWRASNSIWNVRPGASRRCLKTAGMKSIPPPLSSPLKASAQMPARRPAPSVI